MAAGLAGASFSSVTPQEMPTGLAGASFCSVLPPQMTTPRSNSLEFHEAKEFEDNDPADRLKKALLAPPESVPVPDTPRTATPEPATPEVVPTKASPDDSIPRAPESVPVPVSPRAATPEQATPGLIPTKASPDEFIPRPFTSPVIGSAAKWRGASPVGSGPSMLVSRWDTSKGYRTPRSPSGFVPWQENRPSREVTPCVGRLSLPSRDVIQGGSRLSWSPSSSSSSRPLSPASCAGLSQSRLEETKLTLAESMSKIAGITRPGEDVEIEVFRLLHRGLTRATSLLRSEGPELPELLLGSLEPKGAVLNFVIDFHLRKRLYRRQTATVWTTLLQSDSWLWKLQHDAALQAILPQDLLSLVPARLPSTPPPRKRVPPLPQLGSPSPASPCASNPTGRDSPTKKAALDAEARAAKERRERRATRRPEEPVGELLEASHAQLEALEYSAAGDGDEVSLALETFGRAVRQVARGDSTTNKELQRTTSSGGFEGQDATSTLELAAYGPKKQTLAFLADVYERRRKYRSRVAHLLVSLSAVDGWREVMASSPVAEAFADEASPVEESPREIDASSGNEFLADKDCPQDFSPSKEDLEGELEKMVRPKAPWYLRMCFRCFGVVGALRKCRCLVPRSLQEEAEPLLDAVLNKVKNDPPLFGGRSSLRRVQAPVTPVKAG